MKLHILHDSQGRILAAAHLDGKKPGTLPPPIPVAIPGQDHSTIELDVPPEHHSLGLHAICQKLRVDVKLRKLVVSDKQERR